MAPGHWTDNLACFVPHADIFFSYWETVRFVWYRIASRGRQHCEIYWDWGENTACCETLTTPTVIKSWKFHHVPYHLFEKALDTIWHRETKNNTRCTCYVHKILRSQNFLSLPFACLIVKVSIKLVFFMRLELQLSVSSLKLSGSENGLTSWIAQSSPAAV